MLVKKCKNETKDLMDTKLVLNIQIKMDFVKFSLDIFIKVTAKVLLTMSK